MARATIYTKDYCPYCDQAKRLMTQKGIDYHEINISHAADQAGIMQEIATLTDMRTFPQIVLDGKHVGGYTDLCAHLGAK
jgi:glutaredoxin 3